VKIIQIH